VRIHFPATLAHDLIDRHKKTPPKGEAKFLKPTPVSALV